MDMVLLAAALLPAVVLMTYIYRKDKVEREPIGLVMRVFVLGALSGLVAAFVEGFLIDGLEAVAPEGLLRLVVEYFVCVAAVEEACKYACLNSVKNHPAFDHLFDAVVYSVAAALGFAALENVFYVFDGGLETALLRAVLSVPGHAADGVVMGVFYGMARQRELHGDVRTARTYYWLAFLLPAIEHGFYDAALSTESDLMALVAMVFDLAFIALAFFLVNRASATDEPLHPRLVQPAGSTHTNAYSPSGMPSAASNAYPQEATLVQPYMPGAQPGSHPATSTNWYCPNCGAYNHANFCVACGTPNPRAHSGQQQRKA